MPLGDSITYGSYGANLESVSQGGYRSVLWQRLLENDHQTDFVGSLNEPVAVGSGHEGHPGWRTDEIARHVESWLERYWPSLILLMTGTNDIVQGDPISLALERLEMLLKRIHNTAPTARILVGSITGVRHPNDYHVNPQIIEAYNTQIPPLIELHRQTTENIHFADIASISRLGDEDFHADGLHPNDQGYRKMGEAWYDLLAPWLG
jgi:lysophospholipase L1-like esterase